MENRTGRSVKSTSQGDKTVINLAELWNQIDSLAASKTLPPEGWKTAIELAKQWGCTEKTARKKAELLVDQRILSKEQFSGHHNALAVFYAPVKAVSCRSQSR
jgi:hypothetical protein